MSFLSQDELDFQHMLRDFAQKEVVPRVHSMDKNAQMDPELIKKLFELGVMGIETPAEYGGSQSSFFNACLAVEEFGRVDGSVSVLVDVQNTLVTNAMLHWGSPAQKSKYLPLMSSSWVGSYALSESSSGSDAFALKLTAQEKGDHYLLNGHKLWITNAHEANIFLVFANANPSIGHKGICAFIVERGFEGFKVGRKEDKLGIRASSTCELIFENCRVPKENILGQAGLGYKYAIEVLNEGRIGIGAQMLGIAQGAYEAAKKYTQERKQFGQRICDFQGVQFQLAGMRTKLEAMRLMIYNAARMKDAGMDFRQVAAMAKLFTSQNAQDICSQCLDLFGGYGFTSEYPAEKYYRDVKIGQIYEGTTNMQLQTIAKMELSS